MNKIKYYNTKDDISFVLTNKANLVTKKHNHVSKYIIGIILDGSLKIIRDEEVSNCYKDDIFIIPIYVPHAIELIDENTKFISMCVGKSFLDNYLKNVEPEILTRYTRRLCEDGIISSKNAIAFLDAMEIVLDLYWNNDSNVKSELQEIGDYIVSEPEMNLKVNELAQKIYISKYYFIKEFRKEMGLSPHSFHIQNRIRKAQRLLEENMKVTDVAIEMGFYDQSHFVKTFKSIVGITPTEYISSLERLD